MIGIIDYGMGNLQSVKNSCEYVGQKARFVKTAVDFEQSEKLILPGVGAFGEGMENLKKQNLIQPLFKEVLEKKKPLLGICLGMQLLADLGTEGGKNAGLGLIPGTVERLEVTPLRVPHIGWNNITITKPNPLFTPDMAVDYYFVHSYYFHTQDQNHILATCDYGNAFPCVVGKENIFGVQFHPEKSHQFGLQILRNFFQISC